MKVPATKELKEIYGFNGDNVENEKPLSMICILVDLLNGVVIDADKGTARTSEQSLAYKMLNGLEALKHHILYLCDRAYTSFRTMWTIANSGDFFLIRASVFKTLSIKEFVASNKVDSMIEIKVSSQACAKMRKEGLDISKDKKISVRAVKVTLPNGDLEVLLTNLNSEFAIDTLADLYTMRWGVETTIDYLKNEEQIEVCAGLSETCFSQGFYIAMILYSISSIILKIDDEKIEELNDEHKRKHKVKINRNDTWPHLQRLFPLCMMHLDKLSILILEMAELFLRSKIPIRAGRHFSRASLGRGKYITFTNYKRAI